MSDRPNILLITTDQQRYDFTGAAAPPWMQTPNIDHLRFESVEFSRCYADCPLCVPSRTTIMLGQAADRHGLLGNGRTCDYMDEQGTLPTRLRGLGYQTAAIGKMHFHPMRKRHGFDEMILPQDYLVAMRDLGGGIKPMASGLCQTELTPSMSTVPEALTMTHWTADKSAHYIRERRDPSKPFFLWTSFSKPHPPFDPPEPYWSMYQQCDIESPVQSDWCGDPPPTMLQERISQSCDLLKPAILRRARAAYAGLITQVDHNMGRIFEALRESKQWDNTLILFTSDHGEYLGDHGMAGKCFFHEASARVPMYLRLPRDWEDRPNWKTVDAPATLSDILPTFVAAAGGDAPHDTDGVDLTAVARGQAEGRQYTFAHGPVTREYLGVTDGKWKYIWYPEGSREQLFNLTEDPQEKTNLAGRADAAALKQALIDHYGPRKSEWVRDDELVGRAAEPIDEAALRNRNHSAWYGEHFDKDVRH